MPLAFRRVDCLQSIVFSIIPGKYKAYRPKKPPVSISFDVGMGNGETPNVATGSAQNTPSRHAVSSDWRGGGNDSQHYLRARAHVHVHVQSLMFNVLFVLLALKHMKRLGILWWMADWR